MPVSWRFRRWRPGGPALRRLPGTGEGLHLPHSGFIQRRHGQKPPKGPGQEQHKDRRPHVHPQGEVGMEGEGNKAEEGRIRR